MTNYLAAQRELRVLAYCFRKDAGALEPTIGIAKVWASLIRSKAGREVAAMFLYGSLSGKCQRNHVSLWKIRDGQLGVVSAIARGMLHTDAQCSEIFE